MGTRVEIDELPHCELCGISWLDDGADEDTFWRQKGGVLDGLVLCVACEGLERTDMLSRETDCGTS